MRISLKRGDKVLITGFAEKWNGKMAYVRRINGEYHYIRPVGYPKECILECYRCELIKVD